MARHKSSCIRKCMGCNCFASCRTKGRTGQWHAVRWQDVDDESDGVAARPHGRMVKRTRDELTNAA